MKGRETYQQKLERIDGWLHDRMANERIRVVIEGELGDNQVVASLYSLDGSSVDHVDDGLGDTPLDALGDLIDTVDERAGASK